MDDRPRHILVLTDRDWTHPQGGGTGTHLYGIVSRWVGWGHKVTVIAGAHPGAQRLERPAPNLELHHVGSRLTVFPRAAALIKRGAIRDVDVVLEVVNGIAFFTPLWRLRVPRVVLVYHVHRDMYVEELGRRGAAAAWALETLPLRHLYAGTPFVTISNAARDALVELGVAEEDITVSYSGVEPESFHTGPRAEEPTLLYLGRIKRYKRLELLLDVLEGVPEARLHVAGEGDHREAFEAEVAAPRAHRPRRPARLRRRGDQARPVRVGVGVAHRLFGRGLVPDRDGSGGLRHPERGAACRRPRRVDRRRRDRRARRGAARARRARPRPGHGPRAARADGRHRRAARPRVHVGAQRERGARRARARAGGPAARVDAAGADRAPGRRRRRDAGGQRVRARAHDGAGARARRRGLRPAGGAHVGVPDPRRARRDAAARDRPRGGRRWARSRTGTLAHVAVVGRSRARARGGRRRRRGAVARAAGVAGGRRCRVGRGDRAARGRAVAHAVPAPRRAAGPRGSRRRGGQPARRGRGAARCVGRARGARRRRHRRAARRAARDARRARGAPLLHPAPCRPPGARARAPRGCPSSPPGAPSPSPRSRCWRSSSTWT